MKKSVNADDMVCDYLSAKNIHLHHFPRAEELEKIGVTGVFLGNRI